jgi:MFS family permease
MQGTAAGRPTQARHWVLTLLVLHYLNTYMDRVAIAIAAPSIQSEFGFDHTTLGLIFFAFSLPYALFQLPGGWLADRFGPRRVLTTIVSYWSVCTMATAAAWNASSLITIRALFGAGEAGAFPAATRAISRWFPSTERAIAQGVTHAGARLGGAITPPIAVLIMVTWGWRAIFVVFALLGLIWAGLWYSYYRDRPADHRGVNPAELALINADSPAAETAEPTPATPWRALLGNRSLRYLCLMYACYAYAFTIFFTWFPTYLVEQRGYSILQGGLWASLPLLAGALGNTLGGIASDRLAARIGLRMGRRVVAISGFLLGFILLISGALADSAILCVTLMALAVTALELTTAVSWALPIDIGGEMAGTVSATMNTFGNLGGAVSPLIFGMLVDLGGSWEAPFLIAGILSLVAAACWLRIDPEDRLF